MLSVSLRVLHPVRGAIRACAVVQRCALRLASPCSSRLQVLRPDLRVLLDRRCGEVRVKESTVICQKHADQFIHRWAAPSCAICQDPSRPSMRPCPLWLRLKLVLPSGALVHHSPCYRNELARRERTGSSDQDEADSANLLASMFDATQPNEPTLAPQDTNSQETFTVDVRDVFA